MGKLCPQTAVTVSLPPSWRGPREALLQSAGGSERGTQNSQIGNDFCPVV